MEEKTNGIKKLFESDKARKIIVIIGIIGIALIFISSISGINTDKKTETEGFSVTTYSTEIESRFAKNPFKYQRLRRNKGASYHRKLGRICIS